MKARAYCNTVLTSILGLLLAGPLFCEEPASRAPSFTIGAFSGLLYGEGREYVFYNDQMLSELLWPMTPVLSAGITADFEARRGFSAGAALRAALPGKTGIMTDRDWMNVFSTPGDTSDDWLTHYSQHDSFLMEHIDLQGNLGWVLYPKGSSNGGKTPSFLLGAGFRYAWYHWEARDGYTQYAPSSNGIFEEWQEDLPQAPSGGVGIIYRQEWFMPFLRIEGRFPLPSRFELLLGVTLYPYNSCIGVDDHLLTGMRFIDRTGGQSAVEGRLSLSREGRRNSSFFLDVHYLYANTHRGATDQYNLNTGSYTGSYRLEDGDGGGAALAVLEISLGIRIRLSKRPAHEKDEGSALLPP